MYAIGSLIPICGQVNEEQYCRAYPHAVLLMHASSQRLASVDDPTSSTIERIVLTPNAPGPDPSDMNASTRATDTASPSHMYFVFPLAPRTTPASTLIVGCGPDCDVHIDDRSISKIHAVFKTDGSRYFVKDNDSTSGTQVNGELLEPRKWRQVATGDCISLGFVDTIFLPPADFYRFVRRLFID